MDNEAPKYASWVPEAGGYVANGKVVSKSPMYDEAGKLRLDVDTSVFGNTQAPSTSKAQPQVANQATSNVGVTTANVTGSGTDANAQATGIGSLNSMAQNTQNAVDSALSSPAMRSPSAGEPILTVEQQDLKEIQDAHARNDIQGEINGYVKLARDTGVDYTQTINDLTRQRQQKIQNIDDSYLQRLDEARQKMNAAKSQGDITGDYTAYNQAVAEYGALIGEQDAWRNAVGYQDAMRDMYNQEIQDLQIDYEDTWMKAVNDIGGQLIQMIPALMNFQYDPSQDANLMRAQSLVEMRMRNNAAATGMYYSSTTQFAIAQAIGELIPVYQKMAREEAIENFKLLQSTASFLMNLEQTQFDMWKSQIQMKWAANDEKRKAIDQAIQNANARGFYTNEEAAWLGIAPGTESQASRERALDKQEQIEKELRNLEQSKTLYEFQEKLQTQEYEKRKAIDAKYEIDVYREKQRIANQYGGSGSGSGSGGTQKYDGMTAAQYRDYIVSKMNNGEITKEQAREMVNNTTFSATVKDAIISEAIDKTKANDGGIDFDKPLQGSLNKANLSKLIIDYNDSGLTEDWQLINALEDLLVQGSSYDNVYSAITDTKVDLGGGLKQSVFDTVLLKQLDGTSQQRLKDYYKYYAAIYNATDTEGNVDVPGLKYAIKTADDLDTGTKKIFYQRVMDTYNNDGTKK